jgi:serine/threonine-protein kinase
MKDPWALPERIGRYQIRKLIGRGSMGVVYLANDAMLGRRVALKTISLSFAVSEAEQREFEERFFREAAAAGQLSHPGILVVYDVGQEQESGLLYMALEYLLGKPLDALVSLGQPLEWREALRTVAQVAEALEHAHKRGVVHRDIKPGNIMILESGEPKVLDFGIARLPTDKLTSSGRLMGSPAYMSPEQVAGRELDSRTDIFSLGAVLHELLTGERAFRGTNAVEIMGRVLREDPPPPSTRNPAITSELDSIVARCLAKLPEARYPDCQGLADDIRDVLAGRPPRHAPGSRCACRLPDDPPPAT